MKIEFEVSLSNEEKALLKTILDCENPDSLNQKLNKIGRSSFEENRRMIIGQKVFTRGRDMLEYRLFNLIKFFFDGKIPEEQKICDFFQLTATESRAYIRSVMSKYQYELKETIRESLKEQVEKIKKDDNSETYRLSIHNQYFRDELNRILGSIDTSLPIIKIEPGTISTFLIQPSSYIALCKHFNLINNDK